MLSSFDRVLLLMLLVVELAVPFPRASAASAPNTIEQLRGCLSIGNMTKERLNCYDAVVPPEPIAVAPKAKTVLECRFIGEEDERIVCFNGFVERVVMPKTLTQTAPTSHRGASVYPPGEKQPNNVKLEIDVVSKAHPTSIATSHAGGCGSRGGPGYRLSNGKCASRHHSSKHRY
jgi:hypothetical protein